MLSDQQTLEIQITQELLARKKAAAEISDLYEYLFPQFQLVKYQDMVGLNLTKFVHGKIDRLIINIPPRHIKSYLASITTPVGFIGNYPRSQMIAASYAGDLALEFGRTNRNIIASQDFHNVFPGVSLRKDSKASNRWHTNHGGVYIAAGVNKPIIGRGAHRAMIDDPHESYEAGCNLRETQKVWSWYTKTLYTRLMKGAGIALIMQRMSTHDLTARVLAEAKRRGEPERWTHIKLPAISDKNGLAIKYDGTPESLEQLRQGKALWPEEYPIAWLLDVAQTVGPSEFNGMYQQEPDDISGNIVKEAWIRHWGDIETAAEGRLQLPQYFDTVIQSWDMRFKSETKEEDKSASWVVGQVWGFKDADAFLLDQVRGQWGFDDTVKAVIALSSRWPNARKRLIENKANGPAAENRLKRKISGIELFDPLGGDKAARMHATEGEWSSGNIHLPPKEKMPWVTGLIQRILEFPKKPNDEGDALAQAINWRAMKRDILQDMQDR